MIQRIQTLWWLAAAALCIIMMIFPWMEFATTDGDFVMSANGIVKMSESTPTVIISGVPFMIYLSLLCACNIGNIFLFKKRVLQARISTVLTIFSLGFYLMIFMYRYMSFNQEVSGSAFKIAFPCIIAAAFFDFMATRATIKDEAKVRSLERLR